MTGEIKGALLLGLGIFCPGALVLAGVGYVAGQIAGHEYREAIHDADEEVKRDFEECGGNAANEAAAVTTSIGEALAPFTMGASAAWMGVQAYRIRERTRASALARASRSAKSGRGKKASKASSGRTKKTPKTTAKTKTNTKRTPAPRKRTSSAY